MRYSLPAQEDQTGTYMDNPSIEFFIRTRLVKGHPEGETSRVWTDILRLFFLVRDSYSIGPEMTLGGGRADLFISHVIFNERTTEKKFLVVECKAPGKETQDSIWDAGAEQLAGYLEGIQKGNNDRKFGAIAVGKFVRFFEWKRNVLVDFDNDGTIYHIDRQCQTVSARLRYFRDHH
ncbi:hypothetical protein F5Y14DRAFT_464449 [Nemania sp. NC0429]|nr:hypothetical protein F5Y14DRAFT_464449 [Nemania sp. NC0429]